jgi:hypothetical protein
MPNASAGYWRSPQRRCECWRSLERGRVTCSAAPLVELADRPDPREAVGVAELAAERVAGVRAVSDHACGELCSGTGLRDHVPGTPEMACAGVPALAAKDFQVQRACCVIVLQGQLSLGIRPRACTGIRYAVRSYDLGRHAATPLGATWPVRKRLSDEGKSRPLGPSFLDSSVSERQPLPWPGI